MLFRIQFKSNAHRFCDYRVIYVWINRFSRVSPTRVIVHLRMGFVSEVHVFIWFLRPLHYGNTSIGLSALNILIFALNSWEFLKTFMNRWHRYVSSITKKVPQIKNFFRPISCRNLAFKWSKICNASGWISICFVPQMEMQLHSRRLTPKVIKEGRK